MDDIPSHREIVHLITDAVHGKWSVGIAHITTQDEVDMFVRGWSSVVHALCGAPMPNGAPAGGQVCGACFDLSDWDSPNDIDTRFVTVDQNDPGNRHYV